METRRTRSRALEDVDVVLRDGSTVRVRAVQPGDREALERFLADLSEQSRVFRFFTAVKDLSWAAERFVHVDYHNEHSLLALRGEGGGGGGGGAARAGGGGGGGARPPPAPPPPPPRAAPRRPPTDPAE